VLITALRQKADLKVAPFQIKIIEKSDWTKSIARTTPEALLQMNGVWLQKTSHGGGSPFLRGLTGNQTLQILDGIRLNNAVTRYGPNQYLNTIDIFGLEKVEVMLGEGSTQYGSDAFGGTICLVSQVPQYSSKAKYTGNFIGQWTSAGMEKTSRSQMQYTNNRIALVSGFTLRAFGDLRGGDKTGVQTPSGYHEKAFDLRGRFMAHKNWEITGSHRHLRQDQVPVYHKVALEKDVLHVFDPQFKNISWLKNKWLLPFARWNSIFLTLARQVSIEGRVSQKNASQLLRTEEDKVRTFTAIIQSNYLTGKSSHLDFGAEVYLDKVMSMRSDIHLTDSTKTSKRGLYPNESKMLNSAVFALHQWDMRHWVISSGIRLNTVHIRIEDKDLGTVNIKPSAIVGSIGATRKLNRSNNIFASFNSGFRSPNIDDLGSLGIVDFRYELPNYNLKPEYSYNAQAGYRHNNQNDHFSVTIFRNTLRNLITRVVDSQEMIQSYQVYSKINSGKGYIYGGEIQFGCKIAQKISISTSAAYTYGQDQSLGEPMRRIPPFNGQFNIQYQPNAWFCKIQSLAATKQNRLALADIADNRITAGGTPAWFITNISGGYVAQTWEMNAVVHNISNADYRYHGSGINGMGRAVSLLLKVNIGRSQSL
jgi:hemoglobin/transferrin/lactoferrin receptor protein